MPPRPDRPVRRAAALLLVAAAALPACTAADPPRPAPSRTEAVVTRAERDAAVRAAAVAGAVPVDAPRAGVVVVVAERPPVAEERTAYAAALRPRYEPVFTTPASPPALPSSRRAAASVRVGVPSFDGTERAVVPLRVDGARPRGVTVRGSGRSWTAEPVPPAAEPVPTSPANARLRAAAYAAALRVAVPEAVRARRVPPTVVLLSTGLGDPAVYPLVEAALRPDHELRFMPRTVWLPPDARPLWIDVGRLAFLGGARAVVPVDAGADVRGVLVTGTGTSWRPG